MFSFFCNRLKLCDVFCVYYACLAGIVTVYCLVFGSYPFNAFLSAVFACLGCFVLTGAVLNCMFLVDKLFDFVLLADYGFFLSVS